MRQVLDHLWKNYCGHRLSYWAQIDRRLSEMTVEFGKGQADLAKEWAEKKGRETCRSVSDWLGRAVKRLRAGEELN